MEWGTVVLDDVTVVVGDDCVEVSGEIGREEVTYLDFNVHPLVCHQLNGSSCRIGM